MYIIPSKDKCKLSTYATNTPYFIHVSIFPITDRLLYHSISPWPS